MNKFIQIRHLDFSDAKGSYKAVINLDEINSIVEHEEPEGFCFIHMKNGETFSVKSTMWELVKDLGLDCTNID